MPSELNLLQQIAEHANLAVAAYAASGVCVFASTAMVAMMRTTPEVWLQTPLWQVTAWKAAGVLHDAVLTLADGATRTRRFESPGVDRFAQATMVRLRHGLEDLVAVATVPASVEGAKRSEFVNFATATATQVHNGLVPATCALELLLEETCGSRVSSMLILQVQDAIRRVVAGVSESLVMLNPGGAGPVKLAELIGELTRSLPPRSRARLGVNVQEATRLPVVHGSAEQLRAALRDVLDHALEATDDGLVSIAAETVCLDERFDLSSGETLEPGTYAIVSIADDGFAFDDDPLERATLPFFAAKALERGLDISAAAKIARDHGGGVDLHSGHAGSTTVRVWLAVGDAR